MSSRLIAWRIFGNLLDNAYKYGGRDVSDQLFRQRPSKSGYVTTVEDNGKRTLGSLAPMGTGPGTAASTVRPVDPGAMVCQLCADWSRPASDVELGESMMRELAVT